MLEDYYLQQQNLVLCHLMSSALEKFYYMLETPKAQSTNIIK